MIDSDEFPTDLPDDPAGKTGALGWAAGVIALTAMALASFNAGAISAWADDLSPGPGTTRVVAMASAWEEATASVGLGTPHAGLHRIWKRAETAQWGRHDVEMAQR
jgi:hypothetical protein